MEDLRQLFESSYPGKDIIYEKLIKPIFPKAGDLRKSTNIELEETEKNRIESFHIFAQQTGAFEITFADIELKPYIDLKRNRVNIQNCIRRVLDNFSNAVVFFHNADNPEEWRISYIYRETSNATSTSAKRYTYLCGKNHACRTVAERFEVLRKDGVTDKKMLEAFSVESLTKQFYKELFAWYEWACKTVKFPSENCKGSNAELTNENNNLQMIRLITRIMFVWFIKHKDLIPAWIFNKNEVGKILADSDLNSLEKGNYYNGILQNLFFGALNKKIEERGFANNSGGAENDNHYGIKTYYRDDNKQSFFKISQEQVVEMFKPVPYLNGGLFECLDWDENNDNGKNHIVHYVDGFSREQDRRAFVPNELFWNDENGLINILGKYNFTVEENTPNDVQVALDPELLGKVFENLLGSYNPETSESARKESGSFYTPREIVSYMVNSSVKAYLQEKVSDVSKENLERLTNDDKSDDVDIELTPEQIERIRKALFEIKILDPACGSGAFPMGILNKLVNIHVLLNNLSAKKDTQTNLTIKKGQCINYIPRNSELEIKAEYLGGKIFNLSVNGETEDKKYNSQDLALHVKEIINEYNKQHGKKTIANLFSQGRIDNEETFNTIKSKREIKRIVDEETNEIIWQYKTYDVENKFRQYRNEEQTSDSADSEEEEDFEHTKDLYNLKMKIIEDSIFGVDIQSIAVQICKLRFFISLICEQDKAENEENYGYNPLPNLETKFVAANSLIGLVKKDTKKETADLFQTDDIKKTQKELQDLRHKHFKVTNVNEKIEIREKDKKLRGELAKLLEQQKMFAPKDAIQLANWNPYNQNAVSDFFDAEWMFGIKDGFDVVIANPPYIPTESISKDYKIEYEKRYVSAFGRINIYPIFYEQGINLLKENGILSYITPYTILKNKYYIKARSVILTKTSILDLIDLTGMNVFDAIVDSIIMVLKKGFKDNNSFNYKSKIENMNFINQSPTKVSQKLILQSNDLSFSNIGLNFNFLKIQQGCLPIKEVVSFKQGIITGNNKLFISTAKNKLSKKVLTGSDFNKYYLSWSGKYVTYDFTKLHRPRTKEIFETNPKLLLRQTGSYPICMIDCDSYYTLDTVHNGIMINNSFNIKYVLALINSTLLKFLYNSSINETGKVFAQVKIMYIDPLPIKDCNREQQKPIIDLVDKILAAKKADNTADTSAMEAEIDDLVYSLYGLTKEEIKIVEGK